MTAFNQTPPPDELRDRLFVEDGRLYWKPEFYDNRWKRTEKPIGSLNTSGYLTVRLSIDGDARTYYVHRLIYWLVTGDWPEVLDHINRNKLDNRIENLRSVKLLDNCRNKSIATNNKTGYTGVFKTVDGTYQVRINDGKSKTNSIHGFKTLEAAALARDVLAYLLYGEVAPLRLLDNPNIELNGSPA
ncbi:HNH endonuclease [Salmonella enterica]|nr:HNH endonuclease [Salmonella enterica]